MASSLTILPKETYLAMIENAEGAKLFRSLYAQDAAGKRDILRSGDVSCAFFVSFILHHFGLTKAPHATVSGLERDLIASGWRVVEEPHAGDVLIWAPAPQKSGEVHAHSGFYLGSGEAMSHSDEARAPVRHPFDTRPLTAIYTHHFLA